jgi:TRAP transporter TAXI family solute receptor
MKRALTVGLVAMLVVSSAAIGATRVSIGTGPWSGVFFPVGSGLATILNRYVPNIEATAVAVEGSAHALELLQTGELTLAIVTLATAHAGARGQAPFDKKYGDVAFVMAAMDAGQTVVTGADSGIRTYADLKGLRIGTNTPASAVLLVAALKAYGLEERDVHLTVMNYAEQIDALREHAIDAGFLPVSPYNADVADLASDTAIRIIGLDTAKATTFEAGPDWTAVRIKARTYHGQHSDLVVPGSRTVLLAHKHADSMLIYRIVKSIAEHNRALEDLHPGGAEFSADKTRFFVERKLVPMAFHPGAERFWRERGVLP